MKRLALLSLLCLRTCEPEPEPVPCAEPTLSLELSPDFNGDWMATVVVPSGNDKPLVSYTAKLTIEVSGQYGTISGLCPNGSGILPIYGLGGGAFASSKTYQCSPELKYLPALSIGHLISTLPVSGKFNAQAHGAYGVQSQVMGVVITLNATRATP